MRENRLSGSEGGATLVQSSLPLSIILSLRDITSTSTPVTRWLKGTFRSLNNPNYRIWASGAFLSNVGTWMQRVARLGGADSVNSYYTDALLRSIHRLARPL
jgi:hypothetical protein